MKRPFNVQEAEQASWKNWPGLKEETEKVSESMKERGSEFVKQIGNALQVATAAQAQKIRLAFPEYWWYFLKSESSVEEKKE